MRCTHATCNKKTAMIFIVSRTGSMAVFDPVRIRKYRCKTIRIFDICNTFIFRQMMRLLNNNFICCCNCVTCKRHCIFPHQFIFVLRPDLAGQFKCVFTRLDLQIGRKNFSVLCVGGDG